jgi:outer membrane protein, adhesin transport system
VKFNVLTQSMAALLLAFMSSQVFAEDLKAVAKNAIEKNPEVQSQWHNFVEATSNQKQAKAGYLPTVDFNVTYGKEDREFDNRDWFNQGQTELTLTQMLFDGFRVRSRVKQGDYAALKSYYELNDAVERKALEASQSYVDVLRYRELVRLAQANFDNHQRVYNQIEQRAQQGVGNRADLSQISGRLSLAQTNLMTEKSNLNDVTYRFISIVGYTPKDLDPVILDTYIPSSLDGLIDATYQHNYGLRAALSDIEYARAGVEEQKANFYPNLAFVARTGYYKNRNSFDEWNDQREHGRDSIVELRLNYNLFNGGADKAAYKSANSRVYKAEDVKSQMCIDLRKSISTAFNNVSNLESQMEWLQRHRDESAAVVKAYNDQFDIGRRSLLDVLDSENEGFQSNRSYASAQYDLMNAQLQVLYSTGKLLPVLGIQRDNVPTASEVTNRQLDTAQVCNN